MLPAPSGSFFLPSSLHCNTHRLAEMLWKHIQHCCSLVFRLSSSTVCLQSPILTSCAACKLSGLHRPSWARVMTHCHPTSLCSASRQATWQMAAYQ